MRSTTNLIRLLAACVVMSIAGAGCTATETVTVLPEAVAAATAAAEVGAAGAPDIAATEPTPVPDTAPATPAGRIGESCTYLGVDSFNDMQIQLTFSSALETQQDANGTYRVLDGTGAELANSFAFFEDLLPGEQVRMDVDTLEEPPLDPVAAAGITCEFVGLDSFGSGFEPFRPAAGDTCRFVEIDAFGDIQIELEFTNPFDVAGDVAVDFALRGPDGVRFEDGVSFVEAGPGERVVEAVDSLAEFPSWVNESDFSCNILAIEGFNQG